MSHRAGSADRVERAMHRASKRRIHTRQAVRLVRNLARLACPSTPNVEVLEAIDGHEIMYVPHGHKVMAPRAGHDLVYVPHGHAVVPRELAMLDVEVAA